MFVEIFGTAGYLSVVTDGIPHNLFQHSLETVLLTPRNITKEQTDGQTTLKCCRNLSQPEEHRSNGFWELLDPKRLKKTLYTYVGRQRDTLDFIRQFWFDIYASPTTLFETTEK